MTANSFQAKNKAAGKKIVKYIQLFANIVILYNAVQMTKFLAALAESGHEVAAETLAGFSPYRTSHINLYGELHIDLNRPTESLDFNAKINA